MDFVKRERKGRDNRNNHCFWRRISTKASENARTSLRNLVSCSS
jgi:hypothetical protein